MILLIISIVLFILYALLVLYYWHSWRLIPEFSSSLISKTVSVSVIIPARNEEENIGTLLNSLLKQTYPASHLEIIVVDDHSTDNTAEIVRQFSTAKLLQLKDDNINSYKKKAIETGINIATGELIITTDADCIAPEKWIETIVSFKQINKSSFVAAPVVIECNNNLLQIFQALDFAVLQGITGAVVQNKQLSMCNGANLAYEKKVFEEVNGFSSIDHIASGDDMLLMHKIVKKYPNAVHYLKSKNAIVSTQPMKSWRAFFNQRIRWASKAGQYNDKRILPVLLLVYLFNLLFLVLGVAMVWNYKFMYLIIGLWVVKTITELPLFISVARFLGKEWSIKWFLLFQPIHILYTIISGLFGQFGKYEWKGRRVQ